MSTWRLARICSVSMLEEAHCGGTAERSKLRNNNDWWIAKRKAEGRIELAKMIEVEEGWQGWLEKCPSVERIVSQSCFRDKIQSSLLRCGSTIKGQGSKIPDRMPNSVSNFSISQSLYLCHRVMLIQGSVYKLYRGIKNRAPTIQVPIAVNHFLL